jgi:guanylate kinase
MPTNLVTVSGPRGAGRDTLILKILESLKSQMYRVVPCTTRGPRIGEFHGIHQYFLTEEEFKKNEDTEKFIFTNPPHSGYRSGTLQSELTHDLSIVDVTAFGAGVLRDYVFSRGGRAISFFLYTDFNTRFHRIQERQLDLTPLQITDLMELDPTDENPDNHPNWFIKIENPNDYFEQTFQKAQKEIDAFLRNLKYV